MDTTTVNLSRIEPMRSIERFLHAAMSTIVQNPIDVQTIVIQANDSECLVFLTVHPNDLGVALLSEHYLSEAMAALLSNIASEKRNANHPPDHRGCGSDAALMTRAFP